MDLKLCGQGNVFFRTGAILRGSFENNILHGKCLLSLPFEIGYLLNFANGVLDKRSTRINFKTGETVNYVFENGTLKKQKDSSIITQDFFRLAKSKKIFKENWALNPIFEYSEGQFFGSFLLKNQTTFHGLIVNGEPTGWGVTVESVKTAGRNYDGSRSDYLQLHSDCNYQTIASKSTIFWQRPSVKVERYPTRLPTRCKSI